MFHVELGCDSAESRIERAVPELLYSTGDVGVEKKSCKLEIPFHNRLRRGERGIYQSGSNKPRAGLATPEEDGNSAKSIFNKEGKEF